jgi:hypothetical protein
MMMTTILRNNRMQRIFLLLGIPLITTLVLLISTVGFRVPGFSLFSFAHSMTLQTCSNTQGTQQNLCKQQNPVTQGCTQDAQTLEEVSAFNEQNTLIGEVDFRHSQICKTYWVRTIAYANAPQVQAIDATVTFNDGKVQDHKNSNVQPGQSMVVFTDMLLSTPSPKTLAGVFHLSGQTQPMTILLWKWPFDALSK